MISLNHNALIVNFLQGSVLLGATVTFLPSFLLAIISTLDLTNKKSLSILISHPYLVLLPTFTMFSYSKLKICGDRRIALSPKLSIVNMLLNAVVLPGIILVLKFLVRGFDVLFLLPLLAALFTLLFLYIQKISCCSCCRSAGRIVRVFDPEQPEKTFIMEGELWTVEANEDPELEAENFKEEEGKADSVENTQEEEEKNDEENKDG